MGKNTLWFQYAQYRNASHAFDTRRSVVLRELARSSFPAESESMTSQNPPLPLSDFRLVAFQSRHE
jgi:hypothetical protein